MATLFQQIFGTKAGAAVEASPLVQEGESLFEGLIVRSAPKAAPTVVEAINHFWPGTFREDGVPTPITPAPLTLTEDEFARAKAALDATLAQYGVPTTDDAGFDAAFGANLTAQGFTLPTG